ncbi:uncharacterized protein LOC130360842 [Hyla sarda]|uniref:uncharacterized protein LOC130360842 n=1 Tax=Hyla sarda TaxID=327740 RepID=UPI0024C422F6|nr:uncharacterized protein LOC130360842 [Hyla sarda]
MGSWELRGLFDDNQTWLNRPENAGQTILRDGLRSAQRRRERMQTRADLLHGRPSGGRERGRPLVTPTSAQPDYELTEYELGEEVTAIPCGHPYHHPCIAQWLRRNSFCPLC